jgi:carboxyl-terminal processing protease
MAKEIKLLLVAALLAAVAALAVLLIAGCGTAPALVAGADGELKAVSGDELDDAAAIPERDRPLTAESRRLNAKSFDYVWAKIHESLWPEALEEAGWDAAHLEFRPRIDSASTMGEWRRTMMEMLDRLRLSHTQIIPGEAYAKHLADGSGGGSRDGGTGITVRVLGGLAVVTEVEGESSAWAAGVRPGWIIESLGGKDVAEGLQELAAIYEGHHLRDLTLASITQFSLTGDTGDEISAVFLDGNDDPVELDLVYEPVRGERFEYANLPAMYVRVDTATAAGDIEIFRFNTFMDPMLVIPAFERAVGRAAEGRGLVIDIRGNMGGMGAMASWLTGFLFEEKGTSFGRFRMKDTELDLVVMPRPGAYTGPVAVLVDGLSLSASEFFADGMQKSGRAKVFGQRTPGFALPSIVEKLPNGDAVQYVHADYVNSEGERLEGKGVTPDFEIVPSRAVLLDGKDPVLDAAVEWIAAEAVKGKR